MCTVANREGIQIGITGEITVCVFMQTGVTCLKLNLDDRTLDKKLKLCCSHADRVDSSYLLYVLDLLRSLKKWHDCAKLKTG